MKKWFHKNSKTIIVSAFLIPIIIVAFVSIYHVTVWYGISNPLTWASYLSIGVEIAALSALAAISANMGSKVYFPFIIVTIIQFIGNIFFSYQFIDINSKIFKDWVDLVSPLLSTLGVEPTDMVGQKRMLALFSGGLLPLISLSFLHMLVKFTENTPVIEQKNIDVTENKNVIDDKIPFVEAKDLVSELTKARISDEDMSILENILLKNSTDTDEKVIQKVNEPVTETTDNKIEKVSDKEIEDELYDEIKNIEESKKIEDNNLIIEEEKTYDFENEESQEIFDEQIQDTETPITEIDIKDDVTDKDVVDLVKEESIIEESKDIHNEIKNQNEDEIISDTNYSIEKKN